MSAITDTPRGAKVVGTIDIAVTWEGALPILIAGLVNGTTEGRRLAIEQLERMARVADGANGMLEALRKLVNAADSREVIMGDVSSLLDCKANLKAAADAGRAAIAKAEGCAND